MRKLFITLALILSIGTASAQSNIVRQGNTFVQQGHNTPSVSDVKTGFTYKDSKGNVYDIYLSRNGRAYVNRTSKAGNNYKQYWVKTCHVRFAEKWVKCTLSGKATSNIYHYPPLAAC